MAWAQFVDLIYGLLVVVSTALGGSMGWAIAVVSPAVRVALLPLTLRVAYRGLEMRATLKRLEPELKRVRTRPDLPLAAICAVLTALSSWLAPEVSPSQRAPMVVLPALLTLSFLSRLAAGLSVYALAQGVVGLGQAVLIHRKARQVG